MTSKSSDFRLLSATARRFFFFLLLLSAREGMGQVVATFDANGTFDAIQTLNDVTIEVWGGGGAGASNNNAGGGGGGGGGYARRVYPTLAAGQYSVTVGTGGQTAGAAGGTSSFSTLVVSGGGSGGNGVSGGAGGQGINGSFTFSGGVGGGGVNGGGGGGSGGSAFSNAAGNPGVAANGANGGAGGAGTGTGGSGGSKSGNVNATAGASPGAGGGGGRDNNTDFGAGAPGRVVITYNLSPLPVELTHFEARPETEGIALHWQTASETDNESFTVEHSRDGRRFQALAVVPGAGTTTMPQAYRYLHGLPPSGDNYYRLRQVDYDGAFEYSPVRVVRWQGPAREAWTLHHNITSSSALLQRTAEGQPMAWHLLNTAGQPLGSGTLPGAAGPHWLDLSSFPAGMYLLRIEDPAGPWSRWIRKE